MTAKQLIEDLISELIDTDNFLRQRCEALAALQTVLAKRSNETNARIDTMNDNIHILIARVSALEAKAAPDEWTLFDPADDTTHPPLEDQYHDMSINVRLRINGKERKGYFYISGSNWYAVQHVSTALNDVYWNYLEE